MVLVLKRQVVLCKVVLLLLVIHVLLSILLSHNLVLSEGIKMHLLQVVGKRPSVPLARLEKKVLGLIGHLVSAVEALIASALGREGLL